MGRCGLVVASHACFLCKKSHPDPRTTWNFRHFRQGFKQDSKVRRLDRHFATPQYWNGIWSQSETSSNKASTAIPQYWTVFKASLKSASIRLQIRFPNTGSVLEASLKSASKSAACSKLPLSDKACTDRTYTKTVFGQSNGRRTTVARIPASTCRNQENMLCPTAKPVTVAFFEQECAKPKKFAPSTAKPCDSCHFSSHVWNKAIHVRAKFNSLPEVQQLACLVLSVDTKHKHDTTCVCTLPVCAGVAPILVEA